jgi:hypothetical protein
MPNPNDKLNHIFNGRDCDLQHILPCWGKDVDDFGIVWLTSYFAEHCPINSDSAVADALAMMTRVICIAAVLRTTDLEVIAYRLAARRNIVRPLLQMLTRAGWSETLLPDLQNNLAQTQVDPWYLHEVVEDWVCENIIVDDGLEILTDIGEAIGDAIRKNSDDTLSFEPWMAD